jgi:hypothetical protein
LEASSFSAPFPWGSIADRAVLSAATPAATAASLATRFSFDVLGRLGFFDGRLVFVCLRVFDLAATRFELFFDLTCRFDEVLDLARFFAFFMIPPFGSIYFRLGFNPIAGQAVGMDFGPASEADPGARHRMAKATAAPRKARSVARQFDITAPVLGQAH